MNPLFLISGMQSLRKEAAVVVLTLVVIFALPVVALLSLTDVTALADPSVRLYDGPASTLNTYDYGFCTFWAAKRREEVGLAIPNNWGNANTWDDRALNAGYGIDHTPVQYAIMQTDAGDLGHVAFVERVLPGGGWEVSEMNVRGWDILSSRIFTADQAVNYRFIH